MLRRRLHIMWEEIVLYIQIRNKVVSVVNLPEQVTSHRCFQDLVVLPHACVMTSVLWESLTGACGTLSCSSQWQSGAVSKTKWVMICLLFFAVWCLIPGSVQLNSASRRHTRACTGRADYRRPARRFHAPVKAPMQFCHNTGPRSCTHEEIRSSQPRAPCRHVW